MMQAEPEDDADASTSWPKVSSVPDIMQRLLYRDALMLVLDKPAGLPVHAGVGGGEHLGKYLEALRFGLPRLPQLAHRLDRDTSGCLVLGRHAAALRRLGKLFEQSRVTKIYWALVQGAPPALQGQIAEPLLRVQGNGNFGFRMQVDPAGQSAVTDYWVKGQHNGMSWLQLQPRTGRTHQLRVHCAALGCPILGDTKYGQPPHTVPLQLHACSVTVPLYPSKPPITITAAPPAAMQALGRSFAEWATGSVA
jgi:RluA family pseudouridine synthase